MLRTLFCIVYDNPQVGMKGAVGSLAAGSTPTILKLPKDDVIFWFQVAAFTVTIVAGILTAYATHQKMLKARKSDEQ